MASNTVLMNGANNENMHQNQHLPQVHAPAQPPTHLLQHQHQHQHHGQYHHNQHQQHRQQQQNGHSYDVVSHNASFVDQMSMARKASGSHDYHSNQGHPKHYQMKNGDDFDPQSNVYVANLPSDYGKERLYALFSKYGQIVRYKFVTPDEPSQPGYGFVQFSNPKDAHTAINNLEGHLFSTGETIYLSIALRRRSSLSEEPTNLYVKNLPSSWTNEKLKEVFGAYGSIRQSKVVGDGIAFVRFDDHDEALNAIGHLDKQQVEQGCKLEVRFATRKTAANAYRLQQVPVATKHNEHNLYIRNLPKYYNQSSLETLFSAVGKISSAKINENGIAFVRFADAQDAKRAIQEMNGTKPPQFDEEIVVKLAHFDIGDSRNRWSNKFGGSGGHGHVHGGGGGGTPNGPLSNGSHFNTNMYQNHMNAPIGSMNAFNGFHGNTVNVNGSNPSPLSSVPSSVSGTGNVADAHSYAYGSAPHPHHQQQQQQQQQQAMDRKITFKFKSGEQFVSYAYLTPQKIIGEGSYASVASALDTRSKKKYAIKKNRNAFANIGDAKRILRELKLMYHFRGHPNLMGVLDVIAPEYGTQQSFNDVYLIMPKMHMTLSKLVMKSAIGKLTLHESDIQHIMYQICRGLQYMHCAGVIHRDLKPENILVNCYSHHCNDVKCNIQNYSLWQVKITDFGLARGIGSMATTTTATMMDFEAQASSASKAEDDLTEYVVTRYYRAPEVMCCSRAYDTQIDVWSLGCIMGEMYFKRPLFRGNNHLHQLQVIFYYCGTPHDLSWVRMKDAEQWIVQLPKHEKKNYKHEFSFYTYCNSGSDPKFAADHEDDETSAAFEPWNVANDDKCGTMSDTAVDFLENLLVVDPNKRWNMNAILSHSWLKNVYQAKDDAQCPPFDTSFEHEPILRTNFGVRHLMYEELLAIHKNCRHNLSPPSN